jgi:hypothetical protein
MDTIKAPPSFEYFPDLPVELQYSIIEFAWHATLAIRNATAVLYYRQNHIAATSDTRSKFSLVNKLFQTETVRLFETCTTPLLCASSPHKPRSSGTLIFFASTDTLDIDVHLILDAGFPYLFSHICPLLRHRIECLRIRLGPNRYYDLGEYGVQRPVFLGDVHHSFRSLKKLQVIGVGDWEDSLMERIESRERHVTKNRFARPTSSNEEPFTVEWLGTLGEEWGWNEFEEDFGDEPERDQSDDDGPEE